MAANTNPYVGPRTFTGEDGDRFFGRDREAGDLLSLVLAERLVLFYAQSGAGKSSLVNARLIPGLRAHGFEVLPVGRVSGGIAAGIGQTQIENIFVYNLLLAVNQDLPDDLRRSPSALAGLTLSQFLGGSGEAAAAPGSPGQGDAYEVLPHALIVDQFEEIVTTHLDRWEDRDGFFRQLSQAMSHHAQLWVVLVVREDYVAALDPYAHLMPGHLQTRFYMERMDKDAALEAVRRPAEWGSRPFAPGVAEQLVKDLRQVRGSVQEAPFPGQYVEPVQLQVVCYQLWRNIEHRPLGPITSDDLVEAGDVDQALIKFYEDVLSASKGQASERQLRTWFEHQLLTPDGNRGLVYHDKVSTTTGGLPNPLIVDVLDKQYHIIRPMVRGKDTWYELAHDRLIEPVRKSNDAWQERQKRRLSPLQRQASLWEEQGQQEGLLLRGVALLEAEEWATIHADELSETEREFLRQCQRARAQEEREARQARRIRTLAVLASLFAIAALLLSIAAVYQWHRAQLWSDAAVAALNTVSAADASILSAELTAEWAANDVARAQAMVDGMQTSAAGSAGVALSTTLEPLQTAQAAADELRSTAEAAGTAAAVAQLTAAAERELAIMAAVTLQATTQTSVPTPTPRPTVVAATPRPIAVAATVAPTSCPTEPEGEFLAIWRGLKKRLGCPRQAQPMRWTDMAKQPYEHGFMFWTQQPQQLVLAVLGPSPGREQAWFEVRNWSFVGGGSRCASQFRPGPGQLQPINAFGGVWCDNKAVRDALGWALAPEENIQGAVQEFDRGFVLRDESGRVWVLLRPSGLESAMVLIRGGTLQMGSPEGEGEPDEWHQHAIGVSDFWMDLAEVTTQEYRACVAAQACQPPHRTDGSLQLNSATRTDYYRDPRFDQFPVVFVAWSDARAYCEWLGKRLPTEAEWEWAARGPEGSLYPWGSQPADANRANFDGNVGDTRKVGMYEPGANGLYDMAGNVWEWTSSLYKGYPYNARDGRENPQASGLRVLRGGSWRDEGESLRTANRDVGTAPDAPLDNVGFRCARSAE